MDVIPVGALVVTLCAVAAVVPFRRPRLLARLSWIVSNFPNELPFVFLLVVVAPSIVSVLDGGRTDRDWITLALTIVVIAALAVVVVRALRTRRVMAAALDEVIGHGWRDAVALGDRPAESVLRRWVRILLVPIPIRPLSVRRTANVAYGDRGDEQLLDVYRHRSLPDGAPTLIHLHGGRFRWGRKSRESRALLFRLAKHGWTCVSANYHLSPTPAAGYPTHLVDVKRLLAWARSDGAAHGIDPNVVVLAGSSAGAHLTAMAAFTANEPALQPGFEEVDTSIVAGVCLGGYYGGLDGRDDSPTSPMSHHGPVPPFLVVHGRNDTYVAADGARRLVEHLRRQPAGIAAYAELPGGQHGFDLFSSIRFEAVVDGIESFAAWVRSGQVASTNPARR